MSAPDNQTFWDHLDALRSVLLKTAAVTIVFSIAAFICKDWLFAVVFAPKNPDFVTYRVLGVLSGIIPGQSLDSFDVRLINTGLAEQFMVHMKTALCAGVMCASPYILYQLYRFVSPALYADERKYAVPAVGWSYAMFILGVILSYFLIFPLTFRFLGTYQVSDDVTNMISLQSYMSTLIMLCLVMGIVFEMPVLAWIFAKFGLISTGFLRQYRHAPSS